MSRCAVDGLEIGFEAEYQNLDGQSFCVWHQPPGPGWTWDRYAGWLEMHCPTHLTRWSMGTPYCHICGYIPEPAVEAKNGD